MKYRLFPFLFLLICSTAFADTRLLPERSVPMEGRLFTSDPLGNLYVVKDNNILLKYNAKGDSVGFFNEVRKGKITQIDASNPLRVLLFFSEYGTVLILDNVLSLKSTLRLPTLGLINVPCIASSADGAIWAFDPSGMLVKINDKPEIQQTTSLRNVLDEAIDPVYMVEQERDLYILDTLDGMRKFDQYGFYKNSFPFISREVQYFNKYLVYYNAPHLVSYNTATFQEKKIEIPDAADLLGIRLVRDRVYILRKKSLDIYTLEEEKIK